MFDTYRGHFYLCFAWVIFQIRLRFIEQPTLDRNNTSQFSSKRFREPLCVLLNNVFVLQCARIHTRN